MAAPKIDYQTFTPQEQSCIAGKIREGLKDGKERDQAIAAAIAQCAPSKSRPSKSAAGATALPASYAVAREGDIYRVRNVPIFAEHAREMRGPDGVQMLRFDAGWLIAAAERATARAAEGYAAPIHLEHHGREDRPRVGFLGRQSVGWAVVDGESVAVLFADLLIEGKDNLALVARYPYRSVEIQRIDAPEIGSLALLESEVPYFRFPLLRLAEAGEAETWTTGRQTGLVAGRRSGAGAALLYRWGPVTYQEETMADQNAALDKIKEATAKAAEGIQAKLAKLGEAIDKWLSDLGVEAGKTAESEPAAEAPAAPAPVAEMGASAGTPAFRATAREATLDGQLRAAEARIRSLEETGRVERSVTKTERELEDRFGVVSDADRAAIRKYAAAGDAALTAWLDGWRSRAIELPCVDRLAPAAAVRKELAKYAAVSPDVLREAERIAMLYDEGPPSVRARFKLDEYLAANVSVGGMNGRA